MLLRQCLYICPEHINNLCSLLENGADISHSILIFLKCKKFIPTTEKIHFSAFRTENKISNVLIYVDFIENVPKRPKKLSDFSIYFWCTIDFWRNLLLSLIAVTSLDRRIFTMCLVIFMNSRKNTCWVIDFT